MLANLEFVVAAALASYLRGRQGASKVQLGAGNSDEDSLVISSTYPKGREKLRF
jgi:hypothetical protein